MKHFLYTSIAFLLLMGVVQAQHVNIGIKGGLSSYTVIGDNGNGYNPKLGYVAGLLGHIHINNSFAIQPEVVFSIQGTAYKIAGVDNRLQINYINIPLNFQYMFDNGFRLQAGPQLGILVSSNLESNNLNTDLKDNYNSTDIGLTAGISYVKPSTGFGIDFRYNHGITNINSTNVTNSYNRGLQLTLFYLFRHRS